TSIIPPLAVLAAYAALSRLARSRALPLQHGRDPSKQTTLHLVAVDLIEHLVSAARVEVVGDPADARPVIAVYQDLDSFELLAHGIFAAREEVDWQVMAYLAELDRIGQARRSCEKGCKRRGSKFSKAERVVDECIDNCGIAAQPIERGPRRLEGGVQNVGSRWRRCRQLRESVESARSGEDEPGDLPAMVEHVLLRREGTHAGPHQDEMGDRGSPPWRCGSASPCPPPADQSRPPRNLRNP